MLGSLFEHLTGRFIPQIFGKSVPALRTSEMMARRNERERGEGGAVDPSE